MADTGGTCYLRVYMYYTYICLKLEMSAHVGDVPHSCLQTSPVLTMANLGALNSTLPAVLAAIPDGVQRASAVRWDSQTDLTTNSSHNSATAPATRSLCSLMSNQRPVIGVRDLSCHCDCDVSRAGESGCDSM